MPENGFEKQQPQIVTCKEFIEAVIEAAIEFTEGIAGPDAPFIAITLK